MWLITHISVRSHMHVHIHDHVPDGKIISKVNAHISFSDKLQKRMKMQHKCYDRIVKTKK